MMQVQFRPSSLKTEQQNLFSRSGSVKPTLVLDFLFLNFFENFLFIRIFKEGINVMLFRTELFGKY